MVTRSASRKASAADPLRPSATAVDVTKKDLPAASYAALATSTTILFHSLSEVQCSTLESTYTSVAL